MKLSIATWNVNSINVRGEHVCQWLEANQPDVLGLQEIKTVDEKFPTEVFEELGYHVITNGQKTYNGVAFLTKELPESPMFAIPKLVDEQRRFLAITINGVRLINLYVPNGQSVGSDKYEYKLDWLNHLREFLKEELTRYPNAVMMGDFNIAPRDEDVYDPKAWRGSVLVSPPEREQFFSLLDEGWEDTFLLHGPQENPYSWWNYRQGAFRRDAGLRIDHILATKPFAKHCNWCKIDKEPRSWERPSDHTVVLAQFEWN